MTNRIDQLVGIRFFFCALVIFDHCELPAWPPTVLNIRLGTAQSVDMFFVLSGFILTYVYGEKLKNFEPWKAIDFIWMRFIRVYPTILFILTSFLGLIGLCKILNIPYNQEFYTWRTFFLQLFLLNGIGIPDSGGWNFPSWTTSTQFFASIAFPFIIVVVKRLSVRASIIASIAIMATMLLLAIYINDGETFLLPLKLNMTRVLSRFTFGCLAYNIVQTKFLRKWSHYLAPITLFIFFALATQRHGGLFNAVFTLLLCCFALFLVNDSTSFVSRFMKSKWMMFFGSASFSIYLIQNLVFVIMSGVYRKIPALEVFAKEQYWGMGHFAIILTFSTIFGVTISKCIELPANKFLRRFKPSQFLRSAPNKTRATSKVSSV